MDRIDIDGAQKYGVRQSFLHRVIVLYGYTITPISKIEIWTQKWATIKNTSFNLDNNN